MEVENGSWLKDDAIKINDEDDGWKNKLGKAFTVIESKDQYPILVWENKLKNK